MESSYGFLNGTLGRCLGFQGPEMKESVGTTMLLSVCSARGKFATSALEFVQGAFCDVRIQIPAILGVPFVHYAPLEKV